MEKKKKKKRIKKNNGKISVVKRLGLVEKIICGILVGLIVRVAWITLVRGNEYKVLANSEWQNELSITAKRGDILDRNGDTLVTSANVYRIDFDLSAIDSYLEENQLTKEDISKTIADTLEIDKNKVLEVLNAKLENGEVNQYPNLLRAISKELADKAKSLKIFGLMVSREIERYYPNNNFLATTLGGINSEGNGLTGIELQYDDELSGIPGMKVGGFDNWGNTLPFVPYKLTPAVDGKDLVLTIDGTLQQIAEEVAQKGLEEHKAKGVYVVIMDPNNGEVLAMVNKPDYDPNEPYEGYETFEGETEGDQIQNMWRNKIISDTFEPGSTFKIITMIAAMEEGLVNENEIFNCTGGVHYGDTYVKCWNTAGHGNQTLPEILKNSCNVGFIELGERLGIEKLNEYIYKLGFGKLTGIDLPGEAEGIIKAAEDVTPIDLGTISFGQTNTVNAMQLMTAFNAVANGGDLIQPHIVKEITSVNENGTRIIEETIKPTIKKNVLSEENTAILRGYLERTATQDGPAGSFVQGYDVGAKTGTAQKVDFNTGGYSADKYIASIVALAPVDNPQITAFIAVDEPSTGIYYGGQVASPLMKELFTKIFQYMDTHLAKERFGLSRNVIIPEVRGKSLDEVKEILNANNLEFEVKGNGKTVVSMEPYPGTTVKEGAKITLTAKDTTQIQKNINMPDLKGTTVEFAASILDNLGLDYTISGIGTVYQQSIPSGTVVKKDTKVEIILKEESEY